MPIFIGCTSPCQLVSEASEKDERSVKFRNDDFTLIESDDGDGSRQAIENDLTLAVGAGDAEQSSAAGDKSTRFVINSMFEHEHMSIRFERDVHRRIEVGDFNPDRRSFVRHRERNDRPLPAMKGKPAKRDT